MTEVQENVKLTKDEVVILDHGRFRGMMDMIASIEKRVQKMKDDGKELDLNTLIGELAIHKAKAKQMYKTSGLKLIELKKE